MPNLILSVPRFKKTSAIALICFIGFFSCKPSPAPAPTESAKTADTTSRYFHKLRLTKTQFDSLKSHFTSNSNNNQIVFQFYYPVSPPAGGSPSLYGYSMKHGHDSTGKPPVILEYDSITTEPLNGRAQVLGDLQIRISSLNILLNQIGGGSGKQYHFLFTPKFHAANPHEYYSVSLVEQTAAGFKDYPITVDCDPSPPYSAF